MTSCGLIRDGLFTNWKFGFDSDPRLLDLKLLALELSTFSCVRGTRTQPLICVGCSVHYWVSCAINKGGFLRLHFGRRHTFASL